MTEEFELTFLAKRFPIKFCPEKTIQKEILDIYLPSSSEHSTLRIRRRGEKYEITRKTPVSGSDSSHQNENTLHLSEEEFKELSSLPGKRVRKIRYYFIEKNIHYEIDIFQDNLKGLVLIDIEFKSHAEKSQFIAPDWTLADVTQEKFLAGGVLCGKSYDDIKDPLKKYSYNPIFLAPPRANKSKLLT